MFKKTHATQNSLYEICNIVLDNIDNNINLLFNKLYNW